MALMKDFELDLHVVRIYTDQMERREKTDTLWQLAVLAMLGLLVADALRPL